MHVYVCMCTLYMCEYACEQTRRDAHAREFMRVLASHIFLNYPPFLFTEGGSFPNLRAWPWVSSLYLMSSGLTDGLLCMSGFSVSSGEMNYRLAQQVLYPQNHLPDPWSLVLNCMYGSNTLCFCFVSLDGSSYYMNPLKLAFLYTWNVFVTVLLYVASFRVFYDSNWEWNQDALHVHTFGSTSHNISPLGKASRLGWLVDVFDGGIILIMLMDDLSTVGDTIPQAGESRL